MLGKVFGMTDAEWSQTVDRNYHLWTAEERDKQNKLKQEREIMRSELQRQIQAKEYRDRQHA